MQSYILKCQWRHLKKLKSDIDSLAILYLGSFAENYQFVIQNEVQGSHWNNSRCTLHSVNTCFLENDELKSISYCIFFDDRKHDAALVYEMKKAILADLKCKLAELSLSSIGHISKTILNWFKQLCKLHAHIKCYTCTKNQTIWRY